MNDADMLGVLRRLERGEISAEQAEQQFHAPPGVERDYVPRAEGAPAWAQRLWVYPLIAGILVVGLGAWIIAATVQANVLWLLCGLPIVLLGSFVLAIAATTNAVHWLYVDIRGKGARHHNIRFGLPFPLGLVRGALWLATRMAKRSDAHVRVRGREINLNATWAEMNSLLKEFEHELTQGRGLSVNVDDLDEQVHVYLV